MDTASLCSLDSVPVPQSSVELPKLPLTTQIDREPTTKDDSATGVEGIRQSDNADCASGETMIQTGIVKARRVYEVIPHTNNPCTESDCEQIPSKKSRNSTD